MKLLAPLLAVAAVAIGAPSLAQPYGPPGASPGLPSGRAVNPAPGATRPYLGHPRTFYDPAERLRDIDSRTSTLRPRNARAARAQLRRIHAFRGHPAGAPRRPAARLGSRAHEPHDERPGAQLSGTARLGTRGAAGDPSRRHYASAWRRAGPVALLAITLRPVVRLGRSDPIEALLLLRRQLAVEAAHCGGPAGEVGLIALAFAEL